MSDPLPQPSLMFYPMVNRALAITVVILPYIVTARYNNSDSTDNTNSTDNSTDISHQDRLILQV